MTILREMIRLALEDGGFDGLAGDGCGCELSDLAPCGCESVLDCVPGYKVPCDRETCAADGDCPWHISPDLPRGRVAVKAAGKRLNVV